MKILLVALLALTSACVLPSDIRGLRQNMDDFQAGAVTKPEFDQRNADIVERIDQRNAELRAEGERLPTDPLSLLLYAGGMLGTAFGTTKYRDARRQKRGEPV